MIASTLAAGCFTQIGDPIETITVEGGVGPGPSTPGPDMTSVPSGDETDDQVDDDDVNPTDDEPPSPEGGPPMGDPADASLPNDGPPDAHVPPVDDDAGCGPRFELCDGDCVPLGSCAPPQPPCEETCVHDNAQTACVEGECTIESCDDGWVDCDGLVENGCEANVGTDVAEDPLPVAQRSIVEDSDWEGLPVYPIATPCELEMGCGVDPSGVPRQTDLYFRAPLPPSDLQAGFSLAWDPSGIWLRVTVFDDHWVLGRAPSDGSSNEPDARLYDHVEFVFDGDDINVFGSPTDHHLFLGLDEGLRDERVSSTQLLQQVDVDVETVGVCRILTAKLSDRYLLGTGEGVQFVMRNVPYGLAVGMNDFDPSDADPDVIERQHHVFHAAPGQNYVFGPRSTFPQLVLVE